MSIRAATNSDFGIVVEILAKAFRRESFVSDFMHPKSDQYPEELYSEDLKRYWRRSIRRAWYNQQNYFMVAIDASTNRVVGVANWKRNITDDERRFGMKSLYKLGYSYLAEVYTTLINRFDAQLLPDHSLCQERVGAFEEALPFFLYYWADQKRTKHWSLENLGVLPELEKCGHGRRLVEWGLNKAKEDGVAASVVSSEGTNEFYKKCGFDIEIGNVTAGEGNPLAKVAGGIILFHDA